MGAFNALLYNITCIRLNLSLIVPTAGRTTCFSLKTSGQGLLLRYRRLKYTLFRVCPPRSLPLRVDGGRRMAAQVEACLVHTGTGSSTRMLLQYTV